jgi:hypothetical protein
MALEDEYRLSHAAFVTHPDLIELFCFCVPQTRGTAGSTYITSGSIFDQSSVELHTMDYLVAAGRRLLVHNRLQRCALP